MDDVSKFLTEHFTEPVWFAILAVGLVFVAIAYYWLAARAVQASKWWRIGYLPPLALLYLVGLWRQVLGPLLLMFVGAAIAVTPYVMTHHVMPHLRQFPWEKTVNGELHVTLTGLADFNYETLKDRKNIAVLQMANADVSDQTLDNLRGMETIYEIDLTNSKVTDAGLETLKSLPKLKTLRIRKTAITDEGFLQNLAASEVLIEIDARDTDIKSSTLRKWKGAKDGRKFLK